MLKFNTFLLITFLSLIPAGCTHLDADFSGNATLYTDSYVQRPPEPEVYIEPQNPPFEPVTAILIPFRIRQELQDSRHISQELSRIFWQTWLGHKVFPGLFFAQDQIWYGPAQNFRQGAESGADLIIGGEITHVMFGSSLGKSTIALRIEIYDARTGELVWSMAHAGQMEAGQTRDYIFLQQKRRLPAKPAQAIMSVLAADMAAPIASWNYSNLPKTPEEGTADIPSPLDDTDTPQ